MNETKWNEAVGNIVTGLAAENADVATVCRCLRCLEHISEGWHPQLINILIKRQISVLVKCESKIK